ncbi:LEA type 2 family protein [Leadbettera azotonutricia]|uniref:Late embryogenesis abundant protein n=1 Tax=Leadbettera azotonutricia (strain ATCC BAA-888 / DSM 13862 / ZAS-9) TaxID=545695 RepID=F5YFM4_LEAAZ|nr:LEA type 2 family protein [Leadbettera azotonutricia]AEF82495.1 late embryogenesis abundant protein [Leadbettera azotonutricia ZAS-9]
MQTRKSVIMLLAALLGLSVFSCQSLSGILQEPKLSVKSVDLAGISLKGVDLICRINVENPNGFDIPFPKIDWKVFVNEASFVNGILNQGTKITKRNTVTVDVPFSVTYEGLYKTFTSLWETKEAAYNIALGISFPLPVLQDKVYNLDFSGVLPLLQLPKLSPGSIRIGKIDFSGIELACGFNVDNPNNFPIPFPKVDWEYGVNGATLLTSSIVAGKEIAANAKGQADINVSLKYEDVIKAIGSLGNSGEAKSLMSLVSSLSVPGLEDVKDMLDIPGLLPILQKPNVAVKGINIKNLGLQKLEFVINWEVENKNSFAMDIGKFNYNFKVNNNNWAQGFLETPPKLKPNTKTAIPLSVTISSLDMVKDLVGIISAGTSVNYSCLGDMSLLSDFPGLDKLELPLNLTGSTRLVR